MSILIPPVAMSLTIYQGATFRQSFTWKTGDPPEPVDLTGCSARAQIRENYSSTAPLVSLTTENGGIVLGGVEGSIALYLSATATAALPGLDKMAYWDLEIVWVNGDVTRLFQGRVTISKEVTR